MQHEELHFGQGLAVLGLLLAGALFPAARIHTYQQPVSREEEVAELIDAIRDSSIQESNPNLVARAILRLGDLKATEAIDDLVALLRFRVWLPYEKDPNAPKSEDHIVTPARRYPAISALREIGPPALPALFKVIESHEPDSLETQNAMEVIIFLSRYERPAYVQKLKDAAADATSVETVQRLLKAAETLEHTKR
jgi:hypothetical protein